MKKNTSKLLLFTMLFVLIASLFIPNVNAEKPKEFQVENSLVIIDDAGDLLTDKQEEKLIAAVKPFLKELNYNIVFMTTTDAAGKSTMVYSDDRMDQFFETDNNIGFVIDMDNREIYVNTMGMAINCISDAEVEEILDAGYPSIKNGKYFDCLKKMSIAGMKKIRQDDPATRNKIYLDSEAFVSMQTLGIAGFATIILGVILLTGHKAANKKQEAKLYIDSNQDGGHYEVIDKDAILTHTDRQIIKDKYAQRDTSFSSGGFSGGRGSSHISSSGRSHGGGGRHF